MTTPNIEELAKRLRVAQVPHPLQHDLIDTLQSQAERIDALEAERERNLQSIVEGNNIINRLNAERDTLRAELAAIAATEPVAYLYEMATTMLAPGNYGGWTLQLEYQKPCVPEGAVRNLQELFTRPMPAQDVTELVEALDKLARLGNGGHYGNSDGNMIARDALSKYKGAK